MKTSLTLAFLCLFAIVATSQSNAVAVGSRRAAMGNAGFAITDVWNVNGNQATLTTAENIELAATYKNNFGISELSLSALAAVIPTNFGNIGASFAHFGFSEYNENKATIAFAKRLWKMFSLSAAINYHSMTFASGYKNITAVSGEVGVFARFSDEIGVGLHVFNPTQSSLALETKEKLPIRYTLAFLYQPTKEILLCADFEYNRDDDFCFRGGVEYYFIPSVCVRAGAGNNPTLFTLGAGYKWRQISFDVSYAYHNVLGNISSASISYKFRKR